MLVLPDLSLLGKIQIIVKLPLRGYTKSCIPLAQNHGLGLRKVNHIANKRQFKQLTIRFLPISNSISVSNHGALGLRRLGTTFPKKLGKQRWKTKKPEWTQAFFKLALALCLKFFIIEFDTLRMIPHGIFLPRKSSTFTSLFSNFL